MSGGVPNVTRTIFDEAKRYFGRRYQQGKELFDWDVNEDWDELLWWQTVIYRELLGAESAGVRQAAKTALHMFEAAAPTNNVEFAHGLALVKGRPVYTGAYGTNFSYDEAGLTPTNYIVKGTTSSITVNTPTSNYDVIDLEKNFVTNHGLDGSTLGFPARIRFTTGLLANQTFDITGKVGTTGINVKDDLSSLVAGDKYVVLPPALTTPLAAQTDTMDIVVFLDDVSEVEDSDLLDATLTTIAPSQRRELRWMIYSDWPGTDDADITTGFLSSEIGTIVRATSDSSVSAADITNTLKNILPLYKIKENLDLLEDNSSLNNIYDFIPQKFSGVNPEFSIGTTSYTVGNIAYATGFMLNSTTSRWLADITGSSGTFASSGEKSFGVEINSGGDTAIAKEFAAVDVEQDELVVISAHTNASNKLVRNMRMGETMMHRGFNWQVDSVTNLTIMPGERYSWGTLLQLNRPMTITPASNMLTATSPPGWLYIYLARKQTATDFRSLIGFFDESVPNWDGSHPSPSAAAAAFDTDGRAFCIGAVYVKNAGLELQDAYCVNNTIFYREDSTDNRGLQLFNSAQTTTPGSPVQTDVQIPKGMFELGLDIDYFDTTGSALVDPPYVVVSSQQGVSVKWAQRYELSTEEANTANAVGTIPIVYPGNIGDGLYMENFKGATRAVRLALRWAKFNPLYMYDNVDWSQD